ncbi:OmpA/MotB family protein [Sphingomonas sp. RIT328]|uniref:OmpA/MotB family protein n=1 Tax=Sphingomonas sp. RIT328 TaxID=1470591 RepID=UPI0004526F54|nr:flagellar motor protein MotB [Sphingomonas sp. RIT328]EZP48694.1 OmpA/MotB domain-containing protein [Sphingomonas sp. RIT328]
MSNTTVADDLIIRPRRSRRKKRVQAHHGGAWKVAYADFVTAMMAFFMLLWLLSNANKSQLKGLADYFSPTVSTAPPSSVDEQTGLQIGQSGRLRRAPSNDAESVGVRTPNDGPNGAARGGSASISDAMKRVFADELRVALQGDSASQHSVQVMPIRDGARINLVDTANRPMFVGPTATLNPFARALLAKAAQQLARSNAQIAIEGHTDATGGNSDANWQLSTARALAARKAMIDAGLPAARFSEVVGKAGTEPVYPDQPERSENRRITIIALAEPSALPRDSSFTF